MKMFMLAFLIVPHMHTNDVMAIDSVDTST